MNKTINDIGNKFQVTLNGWAIFGLLLLMAALILGVNPTTPMLVLQVLFITSGLLILFSLAVTIKSIFDD